MALTKGRYVKYEEHFQENAAKVSSDEEIIYLLQKHVENFTLNNIFLKLYFDATDSSMDPGSKMWINLIHTNFFPSYHCHDYYEFNAILEGDCTEIVNDHVVNLKKGDILILSVNSAYHTHFLKSGGKGCNILVKPSYLTAISDQISAVHNGFLEKFLKKNGYCIIHTSSVPDIAKDIEDCMKIYVRENKEQARTSPPSALSRMYAENTFNRILLRISMGVDLGEIDCEFSDTVHKMPSSEEIIMYVKKHHATVTTEELSKKFGYSCRQLGRIIKKYTGNNFSSLVTSERLIHAKNLLKNTTLSNSEISKAIGLESKEYFFNMFKKHTGLTPSQYKKIAKHLSDN